MRRNSFWQSIVIVQYAEHRAKCHIPFNATWRFWVHRLPVPCLKPLACFATPFTTIRVYGISRVSSRGQAAGSRLDIWRCFIFHHLVNFVFVTGSHLKGLIQQDLTSFPDVGFPQLLKVCPLSVCVCVCVYAWERVYLLVSVCGIHMQKYISTYVCNQTQLQPHNSWA